MPTGDAPIGATLRAAVAATSTRLATFPVVRAERQRWLGVDAVPARVALLTRAATGARHSRARAPDPGYRSQDSQGQADASELGDVQTERHGVRQGMKDPCPSH